MKVIVVGSSSPLPSRAAPHDRQKFEPGGLRWPHWLQNTSQRLGGFRPLNLPLMVTAGAAEPAAYSEISWRYASAVINVSSADASDSAITQIHPAP